VLSHREQDGDSKAEILTSYLDSVGFRCDPQNRWWDEHTRDAGKHSRDPAIAASEARYRYEWVLSCVDKNDARHAVQGVLPKIIVGASTDGLRASVSTYDLGGPGFCLKCYNKIVDRNQVATERLNQARSMSPSEKLDFCNSLGISSDDLEKALNATGCGSLSENDIERFASAAPEMSVGFVSAAAGVLLAAQFLRLAYEGRSIATANGTTAVLTFARPWLRWMTSQPEGTCDCNSNLRPQWTIEWGTSSN
jgi:hypothetical protein